MKTLNPFYLILLLGLLVVSCQTDSTEPVDEIDASTSEFVVPEVPADIAALMSEDDLALFKAGPGEEFLQEL